MPEEKQEEIFVIMPFGNNKEYPQGNNESNYVYDKLIVPGIKKAFNDNENEYRIFRQVDQNAPGSITTEIVRNLAHADIVIADLTGRNPNVFLELGIRFSLRTATTILMAQEGTIPPFDVGDYRVIFYSTVKQEEAHDALSDAIADAKVRKRRSDSLVFDTFSDISVVIPNYTESHGRDVVSSKNMMFWPDYYKRISEIHDWLEGPTRNGQFTPDAVLGISNGGLIVADLVGRMLFRGTPILSLWANRFQKPDGGESIKHWYFANEYNDSITQVIMEKTKGRRAVILMLDDHLGTGTTASQAADYLKDRFQDEVDILYIPMFSNRPEYIKVVEEFLPHRFMKGDVFKSIDIDSFLESVVTPFGQFPYEKEISSGP